MNKNGVPTSIDESYVEDRKIMFVFLFLICICSRYPFPSVRATYSCFEKRDGYFIRIPPWNYINFIKCLEQMSFNMRSLFIHTCSSYMFKTHHLVYTWFISLSYFFASTKRIKLNVNFYYYYFKFGLHHSSAILIR